MNNLTQEGLAARGLRVKALEWGPWAHGSAICTSIFGLYCIWEGHYRPPDSYAGIACTDPKAAAQADYAARILAALEDTGEPALIREAEARGMEQAAKLVDKRAEEYDREFGIYDHTTGVTEYPGTGNESMEEWESISAAIRAAAAAIRGEGK